MNSWVKSYYESQVIRGIISAIYVINELFLFLYLMFIPIQIAYFWLLTSPENGRVQTGIDITVLIMFTIHILLFIDEKYEKVLKNPYAKPIKEFVTLQLIYDLFTFFLALYVVILVSNTIAQRIVELIFFLKIYKLVKFDLRCTYLAVGTAVYPLYKVIRTLLVVFMVIAYVGSIFYGISYSLYASNAPHRNLIWIVDTPAISQCYTYPFIVQLQYAMYWAIGTASTAAYGDISAADPPTVLWNVLCLAFQGFIFGFYLNSLHSIPNQSKRKQADLLQKFDSFQQHSSNRTLDRKLYLQILCSLEYSQKQKTSINSLEKVMPKKYMQEIKYSIYSKFIGNQILFKGSSLQLQITEDVREIICEKNQNIYKYNGVSYDDLLFLKEGKVQYSFEGELKDISLSEIRQNEYLGVYSFLTGLKIKEVANCLNYSVVYSLNRSDYKKHLKMKEKIQFNKKMLRAVQLQGQMLIATPVTLYYQTVFLNKSFACLLSPDNLSLKKRSQFIENKMTEQSQGRRQYGRGFTKSRKFYDQRKKKSIGIQTQYKSTEIEEKLFQSISPYDFRNKLQNQTNCFMMEFFNFGFISITSFNLLAPPLFFMVIRRSVAAFLTSPFVYQAAFIPNQRTALGTDLCPPSSPYLLTINSIIWSWIFLIFGICF